MGDHQHTRSVHDPYTIRSESFAAAAAAVILIGVGHMGLRPQSRDDGEMSMLAFGGFEQFEVTHFGGDLSTWLLDQTNMSAVADALDTVLLGGFDRMADYDAAVAAIDDPTKRAAFKAVWHEKRTSLSDIGHAAKLQAAHMRKRGAAP